MQVFTGLFTFHAPVVWLRRRRTVLHTFACETESVMNLRRLQIRPMAILAPFSSRLGRSYAAESRVIFWNLLVAMALSSLLLIIFLKKILFDF